MNVDLCCASRLEDALGLSHLVAGAVSDHEELVRLERRLILHDTVFGNAYAVRPGAQARGNAPPAKTSKRVYLPFASSTA